MKAKPNKKIDFKLLRYNLGQNKAYLIIYTILFFISSPLGVIITKINDGRYIDYYETSNQAAQPYGLVVVGIFLALVTPFLIFNYLTSKKSIDVYHALPIKRSTLFNTHWLSSVLLVILPFTLNFILTYILNGIFGYSFSWIDLSHYFLFVVMLIAIHAMPLFVIMNTGTTADGLIHTLIYLVLPFVFYGAFNTFFATYVFGAGYLPWENFKYLTPLAAIFLPMEYNPSNLVQITLYWLVLNMIYYAVTLHLYRNRKSEKSEEPFVNNKYFPIITTIFTPLVFILLNVVSTAFKATHTIGDFFSIESFVLPLGLVFVGYMVLSFFRDRSTKYFMKTLMQYIGIIAITSLIAVTIITTDGFGYAWRLPKAEDVEKISLDTSQLHNINAIFTSNSDLYFKYNQKVDLIDEKAIEHFVSIHTQVNEVLKENKTDNLALIQNSILETRYNCSFDEVNYFTFTYHLKNGNKVEKELQIPVELILNFAQIINEPNYQIITNPILNKDLTTKNIKVFNNMMTQTYGLLSTDKLQGLRDAYVSDLKNLSSEQMMFEASTLKYIIQYELVPTSDAPNTQGVNLQLESGYDNYNISTKFLVDSRFPQTIAYIESVSNDPQSTGYKPYLIKSVDVAEYYYGDHAFCGVATWFEFYEANDDLNAITDPEKYTDRIQGSHLRNKSTSVIYLDNANLILPVAP